MEQRKSEGPSALPGIEDVSLAQTQTVVSFSCLKPKPAPFGCEKSFSRRARNGTKSSISNRFPPARPTQLMPPHHFLFSLPLYGHTNYENPTAEETGLCGCTRKVKQQLLGFPTAGSLKAKGEGAPFPSSNRLRMRCYHQELFLLAQDQMQQMLC